MCKFSYYGPLDPELHYYAPRKELINKVFSQLIGDNPEKATITLPVGRRDKLENHG